MAAAERKGVIYNRFGGLRLDLPIDEVGSEQAIDLLDVDWTSFSSSLESRMGAELWSKSTSLYNQLYGCRLAGQTYLLSRRGSGIVALDTEGNEEVTAGQAGTSRLVFAPYGTPSAEYIYSGSGSSDTIKRFDGAAFTIPKVTLGGRRIIKKQKAQGLVTWPDGGNRLVVLGVSPSGNTGPGEVASSTSHVWFSEPGNAESYESTAYVQLSPGDAENIIDGCLWNGLVFIFKKTRIFVFYSVSTDEEGKPVFNYRTIETGGAPVSTPAYWGGSCCVVAKDGVYFMTDEGLYLTTGSTPRKVSGQIDVLRLGTRFEGPAAETFEKTITAKSGDEITRQLRLDDATGIFIYRDRIYIPLYESSPVGGDPEPGHSLTLIYDTEHDAWLVWSGKVRSFGSISRGGSEEAQLFFSAFGGGIFRHAADLTEDEHVEMDPRWQSGFDDMGLEDEKELVGSRLWGRGQVTLSGFKDFASKPVFSDVLTLTPAQGETHAHKYSEKSQRGAFSGHRLQLTPGSRVDRLVRYLRGTRVPTAKSP